MIAKVIKISGQWVDFDPQHRDAEVGCFVVIRRPDEPVLLAIDESGLRSHLAVVDKLRLLGVLPRMPGRPLPDMVKQCIRGGTYSRNLIKVSPLDGEWYITMSSGDFGVVWEDLQGQVRDVISGEK